MMINDHAIDDDDNDDDDSFHCSLKSGRAIDNCNNDDMICRPLG